MTTTITDLDSTSSFNRGPLTTPFLPAASCLSTLTWNPPSLYFGHWTTNEFNSACFPKPSGSQSTTHWEIYYYSPGICPLGWNEVATFSSVFPGFSRALFMAPDVTAFLCCPTGYTYTPNIGHQCRGTAIAGSTYTWRSVDSTSVSAFTIEATQTIDIYGDGIPIWRQRTDPTSFSFPEITATSPTSSPTVTAPFSIPFSPTTTLITPITSTLTPTFTPPTKSTSSSVKVGVGVGVPLGLIVIILGILFYIRHYKRHAIPGQAQFADQTQPETPSKGLRGSTELAELYTLPAELYTDDPSGRSTRYPHELPTS
ncbi:hypothetical protein BP6252_14103 [Coleophoma cylindrospora]|uniref:Mid2 domain-containing protein n=1 Tax=Coleophoma cylindrospora TaxID=1849047 RepID=A0A3D8Q3X3_9HELO|nr:hypothetical protein BP6252_14103 [Coleophoma cylindrospora]